ncbi:MAG: hypothetical protein HYX78_00985 [Armatimonadetes bacterium]|nr:hypothetical protein [Armatimonadota bacterium]
MQRIALLVVSTLLAIMIAGCAKFPEGGAPVSGKRLIITMTVAGEVDPNYHYYVAFDTSGTPTPGPLPVVGSPWVNGWGTGNITNYVVYDQLQPQGGYGVYRFVPGTNLLGTVYVGPPISSVTPPAGANKLQFTIDVSQLATDTLAADDIDLVNINFITTDVVPIDPNFPGPKYYDGLGQSGSDFLSISIKTNQTYTNSQSNIESAGDVPLPNLDIIDWTIEVQGT